MGESCSSGRDLDMKSFKVPGWFSVLVHVEGSAAASESLPKAGWKHFGMPSWHRLCEVSVQRDSIAFWEREFCSLAFCYLYSFLQCSDCLSHCGVPVSGINEPVFIIYVLMMYHSPISHFSNCRFKAVCWPFI